MSDPPTTIRVVNPPESLKELTCGSCGHATQHRVLTAVSEDGESADGSVQAWVDYWTVKCLGCNTLGFCIETTCSEDCDYDRKGHMFLVPTFEMYPHRLPGRQRKQYGQSIPIEIRCLYEEVYGALCSNLKVLAGVGMRGILEMICKDQGCITGNLFDKVQQLERDGIVGTAGAKILQNIRFFGNEAAHESAARTPEELGAVLDVIEHFLASLYVLPERAKEIPQRPDGK